MGEVDVGVLVFYFFFFKQKTAYEISLGLVCSEMCIRDRTTRVSNPLHSTSRLCGLLKLQDTQDRDKAVPTHSAGPWT